MLFVNVRMEIKDIHFNATVGAISHCRTVADTKHTAISLPRNNDTDSMLVFPNQILALFSASKAMREFGIPAMRIMAIGFIFSGISTMAATYAQATNKLIQSIVIQLLRQAVLLLPVMWVCNLLFHIWGIWIAFPITEIVVMIVSILIVKSDKISR